MEKESRISGIVFEHGVDDFDLWEGFRLTKKEENAIWQILMNHETEGGSIRGTQKEIAIYKNNETVAELSERYGVIDLLTAAIMRNNDLSYDEASEIALRLNSSDYIFDRLIDEFIEEEE